MNNILCFFMGFLLAQYLHNNPLVVYEPEVKHEAIQEPTAQDLRREEYVKECQRYGYSKPKCEDIWDGNPA